MIDPLIGRNAPCPCGSGRKYKKCCALRRAGFPLGEPNRATRATQYLAELQRRHPIPLGAGRVEQIFSQMLPELPASIRDLSRSGKLAVGGTNSPGVLVETHCLGGEFVVEMTFRFMQFIYAVIRTMAGNASVTNNQGDTVPAALTRDELVEHLTEIANVWKSNAIWEGQPCSYPQFPLHVRQIEIAESQTQYAELFVLAHEVGHVLVAASPHECAFPRGYPAAQGEELWADQFATLVALKAGDRRDPRAAYSGALFAVRLCAWLEQMGVQFGADYPPAEQRLEHVRGIAHHVLSDQEFEWISPIGQAIDDQLQAVEEDVLGTASKPENADAVVVRVRAVVEELARGRLSKEGALKTLAIMLRGLSNPCLTEVAERLDASCVSLAQRAAPADANDIRVMIGRELAALVPELGEPARSIFHRAFHRV